jgi:Mrp family chromosome partitioning ATPase
MSDLSLPSQPLIVVVSAPGAGRTSAALELARAFEARGETTLLVQWTIRDSISPRLGRPHAVHAHKKISDQIFVMNFSAEDALREYFVEHLHMGFFHRLMLENQAVSDLVRGVPGLGELMFFGRAYWLLEFGEKDIGVRFDRMIIDAPPGQWVNTAFEMIRAIVRSELGGPLESEARQVLALIDDPERCVLLRHEERPQSREEMPESAFGVVPVEEGNGRPRLLLVAGAGGSGKTTVANALARKLARGGARVGLLSFEGGPHDSAEAERVGEGSIARARFDLAEVVHRWIDEEGLPAQEEARIKDNVLFQIARDHVPSSALAFAPAWIAEFIERNPTITEVVVDLPSGLALAELLRRPERFARFADGRVVSLFRKGATSGSLASPLGWLAAKGARGVLAAVSGACGEGVLQTMSELLIAMTPVLDRAIARIRAGLALIEGPTSQAILVAPPRASTADDIDALYELLALHHITPTSVVQHPAPRDEAERRWVERVRAVCDENGMPFDSGHQFCE